MVDAQVVRCLVNIVLGVVIALGVNGEAVPQSESDVGVARLATGTATEIEGSSKYYVTESKGTGFEPIRHMLNTKVAPSLPGLLVLLVLSAFFSTINFYSQPVAKQQPIRRTLRYLKYWISANYVFALIFLALILPEDIALDSMSKGLFLYCFIATALPELSANLRVQLGRSEQQSVDLRKYKEKLSDVISRRMGTAASEEQAKDLLYLNRCYAGQLSEFQLRLAALLEAGALSKAESKGLDELLKVLRETPADKPQDLIELLESRPHVVPKLLECFRKDIARFRMTPQAHLMQRLHPLIDMKEAEQLVSLGITSLTSFIRRSFLPAQRRNLAAKVDISEERINSLRHTTIGFIRNKMLWGIKRTIAVSIAMLAIVSLISWHGGRGTYVPDETTLPPAFFASPSDGLLEGEDTGQ